LHVIRKPILDSSNNEIEAGHTHAQLNEFHILFDALKLLPESLVVIFTESFGFRKLRFASILRIELLLYFLLVVKAESNGLLNVQEARWSFV